jgi:hypothetical protein
MQKQPFALALLLARLLLGRSEFRLGGARVIGT